MRERSDFAGAPHVAAAWRDHRRRLRNIGYRMLGSVTGADDVVQEAFARLLQARVEEIDDIEGWLVTVTSRLCLDQLRSAHAQRTSYIGPWLPEPVVDLPEVVADPADRVTLDESVRMALLVVLEQLSPAERTAFVLHDVFQLSFESVGRIVGRTPDACRQLASRARRRINAGAESARFEVDTVAHRRVAECFAAACNHGDLSALVDVLDPDAVGEFDSGGIIPGAPTEPVVGAATVAHILLRAFEGSGAVFTVASVNGEPGITVIVARRVVTVAWLTVRDKRVHAIHAVGNPAKLSHLALRSELDG